MTVARPTLEDLFGSRTLLGRLTWQAQHGDPHARLLLAQHDQAWTTVALDTDGNTDTEDQT